MDEEQNFDLEPTEPVDVEEEPESKVNIDSNSICVLQDIHDRIFKNNQNFLGLIVGQTGTGKSWAGLSIAEMLDAEFDVSRVIFNLDDLLNFVTQTPPLPKGSVILIDEFGVVMGSRDWQSEANKNLSKILQTVRFMNYYFIFTVPSMSFIDTSARKLIHYVFRTQKIIKRTKECVLRPYRIDLDALDTKGEPYKHFMHVTIKGHHKKIKHMKVRIPSVKLRHAYEKKKMEMIQKIYQKMKKPEKIENNDPDGLIPMDRGIINGVKERKTLKEIADEWTVSTATISTHLNKLRAKGLC